ncbi:MAG: hypothetical protein ABI761_19785 [Saprospiraceae bacterium]
MKIDDKLKILKTIKPVEAPQHLWQSIRQGIYPSNEIVSIRSSWLITAVAAALLVLILNGAILYQSVVSKKQSKTESLIQAMHLTSSNDLYE